MSENENGSDSKYFFLYFHSSCVKFALIYLMWFPSCALGEGAARKKREETEKRWTFAWKNTCGDELLNVFFAPPQASFSPTHRQKGDVTNSTYNTPQLIDNWGVDGQTAGMEETNMVTWFSKGRRTKYCRIAYHFIHDDVWFLSRMTVGFLVATAGRLYQLSSGCLIGISWHARKTWPKLTCPPFSEKNSFRCSILVLGNNDI